MIPLGERIRYFSVLPLGEEEVRQYATDPVNALPPAILDELPRIDLILAPYLERGNGRGDFVCFERPPENRQIFSSRAVAGDVATIAVAFKDEDLADYHYSFYGVLAATVAGKEHPKALAPYSKLLRSELSAEAHGEVDEQSWKAKQNLLRRSASTRTQKDSKLYQTYLRQSLTDTLVLYLHGICCDIDVETGPRQLASSYLRRRLELLVSVYPPPKDYQVLPDTPRKR